MLVRALAFLLWLIVSAQAFATPDTKPCAGLLTRLPRVNHFVREWGNQLPARLEWFLPSQILLIENDVLAENDRLAAAMSENREFNEVGYYEAVDSEGAVLLTSDFAFGDDEGVNSMEQFLAFMQGLRSRLTDGSRIVKVRFAHTHPLHWTRDFFSSQDLHKLLFIHALFEVTGGRALEIEQSILYPGFTGPRLTAGPFVKRTLRIPGNSLSWVAGDYVLNRNSEQILHTMQNGSAP